MEDYFLLIFKTHISCAGINLKLRPALSIICAIKGKARNCCKQKMEKKRHKPKNHISDILDQLKN